MDDQIHLIGRNSHKELIDIYFYTYNEFIKLRQIKKRYEKHKFVSYMKGGYTKITNNKDDKNKYKIYKIYKITNINSLLNKKDHFEVSDIERKWYTLKS